MTVHAFTSFAFESLNRARVFAESLKRHRPEWCLWAVIADRAPEGFRFDAADEAFDRVLMVADLYGGDTEPWVFEHSVTEACAAVKGRALQRLLAEPGAEAAVYFGSDTVVFGGLEPVTEALQDDSIVLSPQKLTPDTDRSGTPQNEIAALAQGVFNLSFLAVRNDEVASDFATWWGDRLDRLCHDRRDIGIFLDQKWCDLVPCFFPEPRLLRDPGCGVSSRNLGERTVSIDREGQILCNGHPLQFFHFDRPGPDGDAETLRNADGDVEVYELWCWYRLELARQTEPGLAEHEWHFARFANGEPIPEAARALYRDHADLRQRFPEPRGEVFHDWLRAHSAVFAPGAQG